MTKLIWDQADERLYEMGLDRGVLYLADNSGIAWNGLTSVEENRGESTSEPAYFDGIKYLDVPTIDDFEATLTALTYPDEFLEYEGIANLGNGLLVDSQTTKTFGLSYRTQIGNAVVGLEHGYKIHILYNLTATPNAMPYQSISQTITPLKFGWTIKGVPSDVVNYRPTAHVILDSRFLNAELLAGIEDLLYGDADSAPQLPTLTELVDFVSLWNPILIVPQEVTGLANLIAGTGDLTATSVDGVFAALPSTRLEPLTVDGFYSLVV